MKRMILFPILLGIIFVGVLLLFFIAWKRKKLSSEEKKKVSLNLQKALILPLKEQLVELDKLLSYTLKQKGYKGNMGEQLKKGGGILKNENAVWNAHKMRNRIAHEVGYDPLEKDIVKSCKTLQEEIDIFLQ